MLRHNCHFKIYLSLNVVSCSSYLVRTALGQVKSIRRMPVARSVGQASKLTELLDVEVLRQEINIDDHRVSLHDLFNRLLTDPVTGLTFQQVVQIPFLQSCILLKSLSPNSLTVKI